MFSKIDISMQYNSFELDDDGQDLCVIVTTFGKYKYKHIHIGLNFMHEFAQQSVKRNFFSLQ
ncbi:hypothetical protein ACHAXS_004693 [Conticribra weissflogii]